MHVIKTAVRANIAVAAVIAVMLAALPARVDAGQLPPDVDAEGVPFLPVNINPTPIPPAVNVNPGGQVPLVDVREVRQMPEVRVTVVPAGCESAAGFVSEVGARIEGPIRITFIGIEEGTTVLLDGRNVGALLGNTPINNGIYLASDQALEFSANALVSGCRP